MSNKQTFIFRGGCSLGCLELWTGLVERLPTFGGGVSRSCGKSVSAWDSDPGNATGSCPSFCLKSRSRHDFLFSTCDQSMQHRYISLNLEFVKHAPGHQCIVGVARGMGE